MGADDDDPLATPLDPVEAIEPEAVEDVVPPDEPASIAEPDDAAHDEATRVRPLPPMDDEELPPAPAVPRADEAPEDENTAERPAAEPSEDVLEETPDFLQDTPDHDRLWFEQRPPRDFDFDD